MFRRQRQVTGVSTREVRHPALRIIRHGVPSDIAQPAGTAASAETWTAPPYAPQVCVGRCSLKAPAPKQPHPQKATGAARSTPDASRRMSGLGSSTASLPRWRRAAVHADAGEDQGVLALEETLRPHSAGAATLGRVHLQRRHLGRAVFGAGQRVLVSGDRQHDGSGRGEHAVVALFVRPRDLACGHHVERDRRASLSQTDSRHAAGGATLRAHVPGIERQQRGVGRDEHEAVFVRPRRRRTARSRRP